MGKLIFRSRRKKKAEKAFFRRMAMKNHLM
jgi:hypothetical protein